MVTPWPPDLSAYDYTRVLSRSRWAWEFLRRNANYIEAWRQASPDISITEDRGLGARRIELHRADPQAEAWGLPFFPVAAPLRPHGGPLLEPSNLRSCAHCDHQ